MCLRVVPREIYNASPLCVCMDRAFLWHGTYTSRVRNLPCARCGIVRHGVATCVTATQATCLGKYLTMPYRENATKQFFS